MMHFSQMDGDAEYTIHKVWDTPPVTKTNEIIKSSVYDAQGYSYCLSIFNPNFTKTGHYALLVQLIEAVRFPHKVSVSIRLIGKKKREMNQDFVFTGDEKEMIVFSELVSTEQLKQFARKDKLAIDFTITHKKDNAIDYRAITGYVGLKNQAATCYMNSVLEMLYHLPAFRRLIYSIQTDTKTQSIPLSLQRLFCLMQLSPTTVDTADLISSFGWTRLDAFQQHDVQEFIRILLSNLETKMEHTSLDGQVAALFRGKLNNYIRCINYDYSSNRPEEFYDVTLVVKGKRDLLDSLSSFIDDELLNGENQYSVEGHGKEDAVMGCKFDVLPPILHLHLTRFEYSMTGYGMTKVCDYFEFPQILDMTDYVESPHGNMKYELFSVMVHIGNVFGGHYIAYCRPTHDNKWFEFNDSIIKEVSFDYVKQVGFGGPQQTSHAYYLSYVRQDDLSWVMEDIKEEHIPSHLYDYYLKFRDEIDPTMISISISNHPKIKPIRIQRDGKFSALLHEVKKVLPTTRDLWLIDEDGFPLMVIEPKEKILDTITHSSRLFAADFDHQHRMPAAIFVKFFYPDIQEPLQEFGFKVFSLHSTIESTFPEINRLAGFKSNTKLKCVWESNGNLVDLDPKVEIKLIRVGYISGTFIYELAEPAECSKTFEPTTADKIIRIRDLVPEIKLNTIPRFVNHIKLCIKINIFEYKSETKLFVVEMPESMALKFLIRCLRKGLELADDDGVIVYRNNVLVNDKANVGLKTILQLRADSRESSVHIKAVKGTPQERVDHFVQIKFALFNDNLDLIRQDCIEVDGDLKVSDVLKQIDSSKALRLLLLSKFTIDRIAQEDEVISSLKDYEIRIEYIPLQQQNISQNDFLIKCCYSHNNVYPPNGTCFEPFLFYVENEETFDITMCRIQSMMTMELKDVTYVLYLGRESSYRFVTLTEDSVLSDIGRNEDATLYIIIDVQDLFKYNREKLSTQELKIYN